MRRTGGTYELNDGKLTLVSQTKPKPTGPKKVSVKAEKKERRKPAAKLESEKEG